MRILLPILLAGLAGCAAPPPTRVGDLSNYEVCAFTLRGGENGVLADGERARRNLDCTPYYSAIQQREAAMLNRPRAQPYQAPPPPQIQIAPKQTVCTSQNIGGQIQTVCR